MTKQEVTRTVLSESTTTTWQWVNIHDITVEPSLQSTNRLDLSTVKEYEGKYKAGVDMPPIELAEINGMKVLINGEHRLEAQKLIDEVYRVKAVVKPMSMYEARMAAIRANTDNGKSLTHAQKREKIERLFQLKAYKDKNSRPRTFEDIAKEVNHALTARYISNWMRKNHYKTYRWMTRKNREPEYQGGGGLREKQIPLEEDADTHLKRAELAFYNDNDPFGRDSTIGMVKEMLARMNASLGRGDNLEF